VTESRYPVKVRRYALGQDSGGAGTHRGGLNIVKEYEPLIDRCRISSNIGRTATPSWGLFGGGAGAAPSAILRSEGEEHSVLVASNVEFPPGSVLSVSTGGGGGFGVPLERHVEAVVADVIDGYVTREMARDVYGVVFRRDSDDVDEEETERLRTRAARLAAP
jgi:N-methylhydantoinase B